MVAADTTFGILHGGLHEICLQAKHGYLLSKGNDRTKTSSTTFEFNSIDLLPDGRSRIWMWPKSVTP